MFRLVFLGPAGSGKGAQSALLSKEYDIPAISTGLLLRERAKNEDEFGKNINETINSGDLVPDQIMFDILLKRLHETDCKNGYILDGFPRTVQQAIQFDEYLKSQNEEIDKVLVLDVSDDIVIKRISGRFQCKACNKVYSKYFETTKQEGICDICGSKEFTVRNDDIDIKLIQNRLDIYKNMSKPIIDYYAKKNLIYFINGVNCLEKIFQDIKNILNN